MKYEIAPDIRDKAFEVIEKLGMSHVRKEDIECIRSRGTSTSRIIARCHGLNKVMQKALQRKAFYVLEFLSERFDKMSEEEQTKVIIHELMHIPAAFGGGFRHHDVVTDRNVERLYEEFSIRQAKLL